MVEYDDLVGSGCIFLCGMVFSQGSGIMTRSSGDLRILLVVRVLFIFHGLCVCRVCLYGSRTLYYFVI